MEWGIYSDSGDFFILQGLNSWKYFWRMSVRKTRFHDSSENSSRLQLFDTSDITMVTKQISFWARALLQKLFHIFITWTRLTHRISDEMSVIYTSSTCRSLFYSRSNSKLKFIILLMHRERWKDSHLFARAGVSDWNDSNKTRSVFQDKDETLLVDISPVVCCSVRPCLLGSPLRYSECSWARRSRCDPSDHVTWDKRVFRSSADIMIHSSACLFSDPVLWFS